MLTKINCWNFNDVRTQLCPINPETPQHGNSLLCSKLPSFLQLGCLSYRGGRGGSEEFGFVVLAVSGLVWTTGPFLKAGAGARLGGLAGAGPEGLGAAAGLGGTGFGSRGVDETPEGLGARFGAAGRKQT